MSKLCGVFISRFSGKPINFFFTTLNPLSVKSFSHSSNVRYVSGISTLSRCAKTLFATQSYTPMIFRLSSPLNFIKESYTPMSFSGGSFVEYESSSTTKRAPDARTLYKYPTYRSCSSCSIWCRTHVKVAVSGFSLDIKSKKSSSEIILNVLLGFLKSSHSEYECRSIPVICPNLFSSTKIFARIPVPQPKSRTSSEAGISGTTLREKYCGTSRWKNPMEYISLSSLEYLSPNFFTSRFLRLSVSSLTRFLENPIDKRLACKLLTI